MTPTTPLDTSSPCTICKLFLPLNISFVPATRSIQCFGSRAPPHKPLKLRTHPPSWRSSSSATARSLSTSYDEWRVTQVVWPGMVKIPVLPNWTNWNDDEAPWPSKELYECVSEYCSTIDRDCPSPFRGKVIKMLFAVGNSCSCFRFSSLSSGSKWNLWVPSRPVVVVAAYLIPFCWRSGIRKVDVQPAPRIRISTIDFESFDWQGRSVPPPWYVLEETKIPTMLAGYSPYSSKVLWSLCDCVVVNCHEA